MSSNLLIEKVARAICVADGVDPDKIGHGMGYGMPREAKSFPLWEARKKQAIAAIDCAMDYLREEP